MSMMCVEMASVSQAQDAALYYIGQFAHSVFIANTYKEVHRKRDNFQTQHQVMDQYQSSSTLGHYPVSSGSPRTYEAMYARTYKLGLIVPALFEERGLEVSNFVTSPKSIINFHSVFWLSGKYGHHQPPLPNSHYIQKPPTIRVNPENSHRITIPLYSRYQDF